MLERASEDARNDLQATETIIHELRHRSTRRAAKLLSDLVSRHGGLSGSRQNPPRAPEAVPLQGPTIVTIAASKLERSLYPWQAEAIRNWVLAGRCGIVEAVTGAGKTRLGLYAADSALRLQQKVVVVVPTKELLHQWKKEIHEHVPRARVGLLGDGSRDSLRTCDILVATVHSGSRYHLVPQGQAALLIADEVHRFGAETFSLALEEAFDHRLGLSATYQRADNAHETVLLPFFGKVVFTLDYVRARRERAIARFRLALVGVKLTDNERLEYDELSEQMRRSKKRLVRDCNAPENPYEDFIRWVTRAEKGEIKGAERLAGMYLSSVKKRQRLLSESENKQACAEDLFPAVLGARRTLGFTRTIESASRVALAWRQHGISAEQFDSLLKKDHRRRLFDRFREGKVRALVAPKVLDEGVDVPDADLAILISTSKSRIQTIQRAGRVLRRKSSDTIARIVVLSVIDTIDNPDEAGRGEALDALSAASDVTEEFEYPDELGELVIFLNEN